MFDHWKKFEEDRSSRYFTVNSTKYPLSPCMEIGLQTNKERKKETKKHSSPKSFNPILFTPRRNP